MRTRTSRQRRRIPIIAPRKITPGAARARRKFLTHFPGGFADETYIDWERDYKWAAHERWQESLEQAAHRRLLADGAYEEIAGTAVRIESRTNLLFSFEKMALRDAVGSSKGARIFALALFGLLHGKGDLQHRFTRWTEAIEQLPRRKTRVLSWPVATVFGFIAQPQTHFFFKPTVTREAARRMRVDLPYASRPSWDIYRQLLQFVRAARADIRVLRPRDMIDMQSFLWVQGSDEYPD
jgi:hypothetical protein